MKRLFLAALMLVLLTGFAFAQSIALDQNNWNIALADSFVIVGAVAETSSVILTGFYGTIAIWAEYDSVAASDSGHGHIIIDISPVSDTAARFWYQGLDTLVCSTAVASLPKLIYESSQTIDMPYMRLRTVATTGTNDSTRFVIKVFRREQ